MMADARLEIVREHHSASGVAVGEGPPELHPAAAESESLFRIVLATPYSFWIAASEDAGGGRSRTARIAHPVPYRTETIRDEAIVAFATVPLLHHETGIKQDAEVLGDGWTAQSGNVPQSR